MVKTGDILGTPTSPLQTRGLAGRYWLLKGNVILPWTESGYLHTIATTTINIILECFASTEKYEVIMCAELSREGTEYADYSLCIIIKKQNFYPN